MLPTASLKKRFISLAYEGLLIIAVSCIAMIPAGLVAILLNPIAPQISTLIVSLIFAATWWWYFKLNWHKKGRTLAMQTWHIRLADGKGLAPSLRQLRLRFMWACLLIVLLPLLAYSILAHSLNFPPKSAFIAALFWWILPWGFAIFNRDKQFLYDFLAGTRLVDIQQQENNKP